MEKRPLGIDQLLEIALNNQAGIEVIERLAALQERQRDYAARVDFDEALSRCQAKLTQVSTDALNKQTSSKYATYAKLDAIARPVYTAEGFSVSFGEKDCPTPGKTRFVAYLSRSGVTREYIKDMTPSTKGPQGKDVMTPIHADAAADTYAKRYLLKDIFNIAIGEYDNDGNGSGGHIDDLDERLEFIANCRNEDELKRVYFAALETAKKASDNYAIKKLGEAKNAKWRELHAS